MNDYYVYEWIRLDTNEPFYVGKGKGNRCYKLTRGNNQHFNNIAKSIPVAVNILHDNLDEETAFGLECYYIWLYRDIIGYNMTNMNDGGEGQTLCGENNPFYGVHRYGEDNPFYDKKHTDKTRKKMSENHWDCSGDNNPMYSKHHSEESKRKMSENRKGKHCGKDNHNYGKGYLMEGKNNSNAKAVICLATSKVFFTAKEGAEYYNIQSKSHLGQCCQGKRKSCGKLPDGTKLVWIYLDDFLSKCEYIEL